MADIKAIAEELVRLSEKEVQELAMVMNNECNNEPSSQIYRMQEQTRMAEDAKLFRDSSPKQYGISLLSKKHKKH